MVPGCFCWTWRGIWLYHEVEKRKEKCIFWGGWVIYLTSAEFDHIYVPVFSPTPRSVFDHVRGVKVTITVSEQKFAWKGQPKESVLLEYCNSGSLLSPFSQQWNLSLCQVVGTSRTRETLSGQICDAHRLKAWAQLVPQALRITFQQDFTLKEFCLHDLTFQQCFTIKGYFPLCINSLLPYSQLLDCLHLHTLCMEQFRYHSYSILQHIESTQ